jgi:hypothetical protein
MVGNFDINEVVDPASLYVFLTRESSGILKESDKGWFQNHHPA